MTIEPFNIQHYARMGGNDFHLAVVNQQLGPAFTLFDGKTILGIGGVRIQGVGEAWCLPVEEGKEQPKAILKATREGMQAIIDEAKLWRLYAYETAGAPQWLKHLGFTKMDNIYVR